MKYKKLGVIVSILVNIVVFIPSIVIALILYTWLTGRTYYLLFCKSDERLQCWLNEINDWIDTKI